MYFIVANPNSERGSTMFLLPTLTALLEKAGIPYDTYITTAQGDAYEKTLHFCQKAQTPHGVIGLGGDGTLQEVVAGMATAFQKKKKIPIPLGIFPSSTGSDFSFSLEGGKQLATAMYKKTIEERCNNLFEAIVNKRLREIDIGTANGKAFLNIAHIGLDVQITKNATELKEKYDQKSYLAATYKSISQHKNFELTYETVNEGQHIKNEGKHVLFAVANGQYYGGGMRICPTAKIDDGKLTLCTVQGMNRLKLMMLFPFVLLEKHHFIKDMHFTDCEGITVTLPSGIDIMSLDGNLYPCAGEIAFKILPKALNIFV
jgi:YegS/Rv2252/BmrU family lipid kinase